MVQALCEAGYHIRTLSLDPPQPGSLPAGVEVRIGDVTDRPTVQSAMQGVEAVIHLAALLHVVNPPPALRQKYERVNIGGTTRVVDSAIESGAKRVLLFSTITVYGHSNGEVFTEDSPPRPGTLYAQTKLAAERIVLDAKGTDGQPIGTVLRLGAVYGSRIKGNYHRLLQSLARRRFVPIGNGRNRRSLIYDRDVATAAVLAIEHPAAAGKKYNVSDGQFHTMREIIVAICEALGRKPPRISLPIGPVRWAVSILESAGRMIGYQSPIGRATIDKYTEDIAVDSQLIQEELGFVPKFGLLAGWKDTVQEMRRSGEL